MKVKFNRITKELTFLDGTTTLNANDVLWHKLEVEMEGGDLLTNESLWVTFDNGNGISTQGDMTQRLGVYPIPKEVFSVPGEWTLQLLIKVYDAVSGEFIERGGSNPATFTVKVGLHFNGDDNPITNNTAGSLRTDLNIAQEEIEELSDRIEQNKTDIPLICTAVVKNDYTYQYIVNALGNLAINFPHISAEQFNKVAVSGEEFAKIDITSDGYVCLVKSKVIGLGADDSVSYQNIEVNTLYITKNTPIIYTPSRKYTEFGFADLKNNNDIKLYPEELSRPAMVNDLIYYTGLLNDNTSISVVFEVKDVIPAYATCKAIKYYNLNERVESAIAGAIDKIPLVFKDSFIYHTDVKFEDMIEGEEYKLGISEFNRTPKKDDVFTYMGEVYGNKGKVSVYLSAKITSVGDYEATCETIYLTRLTSKDVENDLVKSLAVSLDNSNYKLTIRALNSLGVAIDEDTIDLPLEEMIVNGKYEDGNIILTLRNGSEIKFTVSDLVKGLINTKEKGAANGVASLDANGKVPEEQLPDDIGGGIDEEALKDYVKFTDYATASKTGVIKVDAEKGITVGNDGTASLYQASEYDIAQKINLYKPITPFRLDYAVKVGITDNKVEWTDTDKAKACETIGAVQRQPNNSSGWNRVYGMTSTGEEAVFMVANGIQEGTIAIRGVNGVVMCGTPSGDNDAVNKKHAEDNFSAIYRHKFPFLSGYIIFYSTQKEKYIEEIDMFGTPSLAPYINDKIFNATYTQGARVHVLADMNVEYTDLIIEYIKDCEVERTVGSPGLTSLDDANYTVTKL